MLSTVFSFSEHHVTNGGEGGWQPFKNSFYTCRKHSAARRRYLRLATSGMEPMQCTFQDNASDDEDSPPLSQISGGWGNSPTLPVRERLSRVECSLVPRPCF